MATSKSTMTLSPFLQQLNDICQSLSHAELTDLMLTLAKELPPDERAGYLEKLRSMRGSGTPTAPKGIELPGIEGLLERVWDLRESILERINAIEDGSYWDDPEIWDGDEEDYYNDNPDYVVQDQLDKLNAIIIKTNHLFLNDRMEDARQVYEALFEMIHEVQNTEPFEYNLGSDIKEARARYCRCIYETSQKSKKLDSFVKGMDLDGQISSIADLSQEHFPCLQDVIDAKVGEMEGFTDFLAQWKRALTKAELSDRTAELLMEATQISNGIKGVAALARKWKAKQPRGYVFWIRQLLEERAWDSIIKVGQEGLRVLEPGRQREFLAQAIVIAGDALGKPKHVLKGKREKFISEKTEANFLDMLCEAGKQGRRTEEIEAALQSMQHPSAGDHTGTVLLTKIRLLAGKLDKAFLEVKNAGPVGWSGGDTGLVFASIISLAVDHDDEAGIIRKLLEHYADHRFGYWNDQAYDGMKKYAVSFSEEIIASLQKMNCTNAMRKKYLTWAEKIGKHRIEFIVSNKHRRAYERAAQVLGALAEVYACKGSNKKAVELLDRYYHVEFNRYPAFRREVKSVVSSATLLENLGFTL